MEIEERTYFKRESKWGFSASLAIFLIIAFFLMDMIFLGRNESVLDICTTIAYLGIFVFFVSLIIFRIRKESNKWSGHPYILINQQGITYYKKPNSEEAVFIPYSEIKKLEVKSYYRIVVRLDYLSIETLTKSHRIENISTLQDEQLFQQDLVKIKNLFQI
jgi:hypothetical protein